MVDLLADFAGFELTYFATDSAADVLLEWRNLWRILWRSFFYNGVHDLILSPQNFHHKLPLFREAILQACRGQVGT